MFQAKRQLREESAAYKAKINELEDEVALCKANAVHDKEALDSQQVALAKMEQANHFEILKLEKKIADQVRHTYNIPEQGVLHHSNLSTL